MIYIGFESLKCIIYFQSEREQCELPANWTAGLSFLMVERKAVALSILRDA